VRIDDDTDLVSVEDGVTAHGGWDVVLWSREGQRTIVGNFRVQQLDEAHTLRDRMAKAIASWFPESFDNPPTAEEVAAQPKERDR